MKRFPKFIASIITVICAGSAMSMADISRAGAGTVEVFHADSLAGLML